MTDTLTLPAPAKLNLCLLITGRRPDGYHNLQTLFQILDYSDTLHFTANNTGAITLDPELPGVATEENLIYRAARLLQEHAGCSAGAAIQIEKKLPMGGGLGGGSSNAATTLVGLNRLWHLGLNMDELAALGQQLGADVPVFVRGQTAWAEGTGDKLQPVEIKPVWYLVLVPPVHASTAAVFSNEHLTRNSRPIKIRAFLEQGGQNDCQNVAEMLYPPIREARKWLDNFAKAQMTGTGACVFACFDTQSDAEAVLGKIPQDLQGFVARGVNQSPLYCQLPSNN